MRFVEDLTLDLGYRYSDYTTDINTDTYKYAGTWTIDNQLKLRASYQRAVRAPNIVETVRSGHRQPVLDGQRSVQQGQLRATRSASAATPSLSARAPV